VQHLKRTRIINADGKTREDLVWGSPGDFENRAENTPFLGLACEERGKKHGLLLQTQRLTREVIRMFGSQKVMGRSGSKPFRDWGGCGMRDLLI